MTSINIHTENQTVYEFWQYMKGPLNKIIKEKGGEIKTCGVRYWDRTIQLDCSTAEWSNREISSKPNRWLLQYEQDKKQLIPSSRIAYFNLRNEALIFVCRIFISTKYTEHNSFLFPENTEWMVVFVAKSLIPRGSSSAVVLSDRISNGQLTITTDDKEHFIPLDSIGLISPLDLLDSPKLLEIHNSLVSFLSEGVPLFELSSNHQCESFLKRIDSIKLQPSTLHLQENKQSCLEGIDIKYCEKLFNRGNSNLILWGREYKTICTIISHLIDSLDQEALQFDCLPNWDENTFTHITKNINISGKVIFIHHVERINPELVFPSLFLDNQKIDLIDKSGEIIPYISQLPTAWVLVSYKPTTGEISKLYRTLSHHFSWFYCENEVNVIDAITNIYNAFQIHLNNDILQNNLFVLMWEELRSHIPISLDSIKKVINYCLTVDKHSSWNINEPAYIKGILVNAIETFIIPEIITAPKETRVRCINSIIRTLEIPSSYSQSLIQLNLIE